MAILTVYTKLLDKTLEGARIIDMGSTKTCQCFVLPYDTIAKVGKDYLSSKYAFYILLGKQSMGGRRAYIGQTNDFTNRVLDHKQKKDWWETALVFVSKADEIFASEVLYLEYLGWKLAILCNNYSIENTKQIKEPGLSEDKKNDMELFFEEIKFLTKFYGCNIFEPNKPLLIEKGCYEFLFLDVPKRGIHAKIQYFPASHKYILKEGSSISAISSSCSKGAKSFREKLISNPDYCKRDGNVIKMVADCNIPVESGKPSLPCEIVTGTAMQGPKLLKNKEGKTFAELYLNQ
ncbi:MAG: GIY-YIG nuclease family protein [Bacteroidaceae bacterium]|nr:GIY-YIG nuclease family protein [Bacteroidales bacterium]MCF0194341.1 GIY-YIG nuclease family protein [Bacteroidaceae bacterium]